jgi:hypothetical protein
MTPGVKGDVGMAELSFPFWIVTQRRSLISKPVEPDGMLDFIAAFSSAEKAATFMVSRGESEGENLLVARPTLPELMADLRLVGMRGLYLYPAKDGAGTQIALRLAEGLMHTWLPSSTWNSWLAKLRAAVRARVKQALRRTRHSTARGSGLAGTRWRRSRGTR